MKCAANTIKVLLIRKVVSWVTRDTKINISYTKDLQSCHLHYLFSWLLLDWRLCVNVVRADLYLNSAYLLNQLLWLLVKFRDSQCEHQFAAGVHVFLSRCAERLKVRNTNSDRWTFNGLQWNLLEICSCLTSCLPTRASLQAFQLHCITGITLPWLFCTSWVLSLSPLSPTPPCDRCNNHVSNVTVNILNCSFWDTMWSLLWQQRMLHVIW